MVRFFDTVLGLLFKEKRTSDCSYRLPLLTQRRRRPIPNLFEMQHADGENLARAAEITSSPDLIAHDDLRAHVFLAIQRLRKAIADSASASEGEELLLDAISAAEHWVPGHP
jgi:hypothetical protein